MTQNSREMFVCSEHLFSIGLIRQQTLQFGLHFRYREIIGDTLLDHLFVGDDINQREPPDGEQEGLCPT